MKLLIEKKDRRNPKDNNAYVSITKTSISIKDRFSKEFDIEHGDYVNFAFDDDHKFSVLVLKEWNVEYLKLTDKKVDALKSYLSVAIPVAARRKMHDYIGNYSVTHNYREGNMEIYNIERIKR